MKWSESDWKKFIRRSLPALLLALTLLVLLRICQQVATALNSDSIQNISLFRDLFIDHYPVSTWVFSVSSEIFPSRILYLTTGLLVGGDRAFVLYPILFGALILGAMVWLGREVYGERFQLLSVLVTGLLLLVLLQRAAAHDLVEFLLFPTNSHGGTLLAGLFILPLAIRIANGRALKRSALALFLLCCLGILSDLFLLPQTVIPLVVATLVLVWLRRWHRPQCLWLVSAVVLGTGAGLGASRLMRHWLLISPAYGWSLPKDWWRSQWIRFGQFVSGYFGDNRLHGLLLLASLIAMVVWLIHGLRRRGHLPAEALFVIVFALGATAVCCLTPIGVSLWVDVRSLRYILPALVLPVLACGLVLGHLALPPWFHWTLASGVAILLIAGLAKPAGSSSLDLPYPATTQCLDDAARKYGLKFGFADYWNAKYHTLLSRAGLRINQLTPELKALPWVNNLSWYLERSSQDKLLSVPSYTFILPRALDAAEIDRQFGTPALRIDCGGQEMYLYNRPEDARFQKHVITILQPYGRLLRELDSETQQQLRIGLLEPSRPNP